MWNVYKYGVRKVNNTTIYSRKYFAIIEWE